MEEQQQQAINLQYRESFYQTRYRHSMHLKLVDGDAAKRMIIVMKNGMRREINMTDLISYRITEVLDSDDEVLEVPRPAARALSRRSRSRRHIVSDDESD